MTLTGTLANSRLPVRNGSVRERDGRVTRYRLEPLLSRSTTRPRLLVAAWQAWSDKRQNRRLSSLTMDRCCLSRWRSFRNLAPATTRSLYAMMSPSVTAVLAQRVHGLEPGRTCAS